MSPCVHPRARPRARDRGPMQAQSVEAEEGEEVTPTTWMAYALALAWLISYACFLWVGSLPTELPCAWGIHGCAPHALCQAEWPPSLFGRPTCEQLPPRTLPRNHPPVPAGAGVGLCAAALASMGAARCRKPRPTHGSARMAPRRLRPCQSMPRAAPSSRRPRPLRCSCYPNPNPNPNPNPSPSPSPSPNANANPNPNTSPNPNAPARHIGDVAAAARCLNMIL